MHRGSRLWSGLLAIVCHFLVKVMVLIAYRFQFTSYELQFVAGVLYLSLGISALLAMAFKVPDVIGRCDTVRPLSKSLFKKFARNLPLDRISHLLDLLP